MFPVIIIEPRHEISNNVVCATSKASDQPAHMRSLIRAFASRLRILWVLSYWLNMIWCFYAWKGVAQTRLSLQLSKCHIVGNHMSWLKILSFPMLHFRSVLDFDFEKLCSVSLSHINVYACLVCGKYFQGSLLCYDTIKPVKNQTTQK